MHSAHCVSGVGDFMQCLFLIAYLARCLYYGALVGLLSCKSGSWRRCTCTNVLLVCEGEVGQLVQPGGMWGRPWGWICGTSGRKNLCTLPCHCCHIYGICTSRREKVWGMLKSHQLGVAMEVTKGGLFSRFSQCNTAVLWKFIARDELNCFCGMADQRKASSLISRREHCQRSSPSRISDTPPAGFEPALNLSSGLVERSCAVVITATPRRRWEYL